MSRGVHTVHRPLRAVRTTTRSMGRPQRTELDRRLRLNPTWRSVAVVLGAVASAATVVHGASASAANSASLTRYPYVTDVVGNGVRINWATNQSQSTGSATWGAVSGGTCTPTTSMAATRVAISVGSTNEYQWAAPIDFPASGTYCYRVQLGTTDLLG